MSQFKTGADALGALTAGGGNGNNTPSVDFAKFSVGTTYKVRVLGIADLMQYFGYGVFKKVNTFVAKNPSVRNEKGFVDSGHTPWDKASQYYYDQAFKMVENKSDSEIKAIKDSKAYKEISSEGYKYAGKQRFAMGFVNLTGGKEIFIDLTKEQAQTVYATIKKYEAKLGKLAFELTKVNNGTKASDTKVTLTPLIDFEDDLTPEEQANFKKYDDKSFNHKLFEGLLFEADEKTQTENLVAAGFDITLIGLSIGATQPQEITEEELPF
jgi:hypothetical protein